MNKNEKKEHAKLLRLWALRKATTAQITRCMELDRKASAGTVVVQNSPEWQATRAQHITASSAPALLGESKFRGDQE